MSKRQKPQVLAREIIARSRLFQIEQVELKFSNGVERTYERMGGKSRGAVMIVPLHQQQLLLGQEYAAGTEDYQLGFPKGLIDPDETPEQAANRELQEEIGFKAGKLTLLKTVTLAPSYFGSQMHIFVAEELTPSRLPGDEPEEIIIETHPLAQWQTLLERADFTEARNISALFLTQQYLSQKL